MAIKLHRCAHVWLKLGPCWRVQKALDEHGLDYELVKGPNRPSKRDDLERLSGQRFYPVIEFEDAASTGRNRMIWPRGSAPGNCWTARIRAAISFDSAR